MLIALIAAIKETTISSIQNEFFIFNQTTFAINCHLTVYIY